MARAKAFSEDDLRLWAAYGRTIKLLPGRRHVVAPHEPPAPAPVVATTPAAPAAKPGQRPLGVGTAPAGLDRASWRRFQIGHVRSAATLDLHGLTAAAAHRATSGFLQQAHARQHRCVEIITGKGEILARELPLWLEAPPLRG